MFYIHLDAFPLDKTSSTSEQHTVEATTAEVNDMNIKIQSSKKSSVYSIKTVY